jgi:hypothetical protein
MADNGQTCAPAVVVCVTLATVCWLCLLWRLSAVAANDAATRRERRMDGRVNERETGRTARPGGTACRLYVRSWAAVCLAYHVTCAYAKISVCAAVCSAS